MSRVIATQKDDQDRIIAYKTDDGHVLDHAQCVDAIHAGSIDGLQTFTNRAGEESIKSKRGEYDYSLKDLPEF